MRISKLFIILLIISFGTVNCPNLSIAQEDSAENTKITVHKPEGVILIDEKPDKRKGWLWAIIGVLAVAGGVAALSGGSSGGGDDDPTQPTGSYTGSW